jgi:hypothetical protein
MTSKCIQVWHKKFYGTAVNVSLYWTLNAIKPDRVTVIERALGSGIAAHDLRRDWLV